MRSTIIIPTNNRLDLLQRCIESIRRHTESGAEILVVDNGSSDGTILWCNRERIPFISLSRNEGFPAACNKGMRMAAGDTIVLLNNDTVVSPNWLDNLTAALYSSSDIGIVGPVMNYASGKQQVHYPYDDLEEYQRIAATVNRSAPSAWVRTDRLVGVCLVFRRELMERIGLLDERFSPGHFEDDDYCLRARLHGLRLLICPDSLIHHEGSASFRRDGEEAQQRLVERNLQAFIDKWQIDPRVYI
ncbi:glycosyltransferase family 2 protein [Cohnella lubricantis]|uniref:Glycosyltransferase family 2 protein n=1 Tax=Cohnella lubricantis TaxID=2163172 RepID=A0A841TI66_9BACL|nr:glycosyltransferase family 2 protein [Cohnella lubricantis]MBB6678920.1 glycosyltransferase family 2 protein [Cohnella lubricantis]MBP2120360.1 GT2 family glycosyltransferase [Cohnella lubricantis]